ncbi:hypothetical protein [Haloplanus salinus]|nr:hypothetical protein [Haloplanus salinus]
MDRRHHLATLGAATTLGGRTGRAGATAGPLRAAGNDAREPV